MKQFSTARAKQKKKCNSSYYWWWNIISIMIFDDIGRKTRCLAGRNAAYRTETPVMSIAYRLCRTVADQARAARSLHASSGQGRRIGTRTPVPLARAPAFRFVASTYLSSLSPGAFAGSSPPFRHNSGLFLPEKPSRFRPGPFFSLHGRYHNFMQDPAPAYPLPDGNPRGSAAQC